MTAFLAWVDAFTGPDCQGNPAGVCLPEEPLEAARMQALAAELGISETAFVTPAGDGTYDLRWFSPVTEIDLCGHATLAAAHTMRALGEVDATAPVTFHTRSGALVARFDAGRIVLDFPATPIIETPLPDALKGEWDEGAVRGAGATAFFTVVTLDTEAAVRHYQPDLSALAQAGRKAVIIPAAANSGAGADYVLRVFGPNVGIDEDPATGSAQCALGPYWAGALARPELVAHQASHRGAVLHVRPDGDRVHIGGDAVTVFSGRLGEP
jgi:predicted PhzF superfamily epimerase YddE/YHI9